MKSKERFKIYIAAYLVLIENGQVLLHRRLNSGYQDGNYSLIAGHLEGGETAEQCITREAKEEAGISLQLDDLSVKHVMHRKAEDREYIDVYVVASKWNGVIQNMEPDKCEDLSWFQLSSLPENIIHEVRIALEDIQKNTFYSEVGW